MLNKDCIIDVHANLLERAKSILEDVSFGLDIMSIGIITYMQMTAEGMRPSWGIAYQARGMLLGSTNYILQVTGVDNPHITDEALRQGLQEGCEMLRAARAKQGN